MEPAPQTFGAYLKSFFKNLWQILKHPLALFPTIIITGVWILLGIMQTRYGESQTLSIFNFLTFAQGGLFGGLVGAIGGILGKILIATLLNAILLPIFVKGAKPLAKFGSGFKVFFRSFAFNGLRAMGAFLAGLAVALAIYSVLNITQRWQEGMVGIAAALLLIRTIGQKSGLLFSLFYSIVKAFSKKNTLPSSAGVSRFISGMSTGFIAGTCLNAFGLKWAVFISFCAFGLAFLCLLFGKRKRAALVAACIAAMLLVPVYAGPAPQKQVSEEVMRAAEEVRRLNAELNAAAARGDVAAGEKLDKQLKAAMDRYTRALAADNSSSNNKGGGNNKGGSGSSETSTNPFTGSHITDDGGGITVDDKNTVSDDNIPTRDAVVNVDFLKDDSPQDSGSKSGSSGADDDKGEYTLDDIINIIKKASTEGWAGEDGRIGDERTVEFLCILTGGLAAGSAGAAAGGAAGGPFGGGTDPLGSDLDWTVKKPIKKDDEEDENFYYNGDEEEEETASDDDDEEEEESEEEEEESEDDEETEEEEEEEEEESEDDEETEEEEEEEEEPVIKKPEEKKPEDKEPEEPEEQEDKEPEEKQPEEKEPEKPADKEPEKPVDKEPEKVPDKEPEKDLDKEAEERDRAHKLDAWQQYAQKRGVDLTDDKGNQKSLEQLKEDITFMIKRDLQRANGQMQDAIQEELNSTLNLINAEYTDRACEMSVNMLAEVVDGGKVVKDMRDLVKAPFVGAMEAHCEGRSVWRGAAGGMADGALTVWQNHVGDHLGGMTGVKKFVAEGAGTIALEGGRKIANDAIAGKLSWDSLDEATNNMGKKTFEYGVGKLLVGSDQGEDGAMVATEGIMKLHDEAGITSGKTISQGFMDKIKDVRDKDIAGTLLYWTGLY